MAALASFLVSALVVGLVVCLASALVSVLAVSLVSVLAVGLASVRAVTLVSVLLMFRPVAALASIRATFPTGGGPCWRSLECLPTVADTLPPLLLVNSLFTFA